MGIEARRNLNEKASKTKLDVDIFEKDQNVNLDNNLSNISDEIIKLNKLRNDGVLTEEEYEKAKKKLLG
jgi:DNA replicative helicase MCM subunit Mcm2 (Cdc46/Mcm family)|tara:strand:+ start:980 stop:1186 length:207 start_codon:yes stop_codon:yes gene_type:complete